MSNSSNISHMNDPKQQETVLKAVKSGEVDMVTMESFWNTSAFANTPHGPMLSDIHQMVVDRLQAEAPDADTLELMLMERVCFLYVFMRAIEVPKTAGDAQTEQVADGKGGAVSAFTFDKTYREMMSLWVSMASDLRKQRMRAEEEANIRLSVVTEVSRVIKDALKDVDPEIATQVQTRLITMVA
jgi:hypothetical protein